MSVLVSDFDVSCKNDGDFVSVVMGKFVFVSGLTENFVSASVFAFWMEIAGASMKEIWGRYP